MVRIAINGFGRIGRSVFRVISKRNEYRQSMEDEVLEVVGINDLGDPNQLVYLLKYDSVHGVFDKSCSVQNNNLYVDNKEIPLFHEKDPENLPWKDLNVDVVLECTGFFLTRELAEKHIKAGASRVLLSAPAKDPSIKTFVHGVNENQMTSDDLIISNASCTTNCLAPIVKVLNDNYGIESGFMTTVHAYTADQRLQDTNHKDYRRGRAAAENIVPTSTGAARAVTEVIPDLKGKLDGIAMRVPVSDGSITDFVCTLKVEVSKEDINRLFANVAGSHLKGILEYTEQPIVSRDIIGNPHSCIFDSALTHVIGRQVKVVGWYDNEWGYSNRMVDMLALLGKKKSDGG